MAHKLALGYQHCVGDDGREIVIINITNDSRCDLVMISLEQAN